MLNVPLFIIEEHHEAFFIWYYACFQGLINPFGNTLLHVDSHDDMLITLLNSSIDDMKDDLVSIYEYVYREFGIASFIIPAIYKGLINNYTFLNRYDAYAGKKTNRYIASYKSQGKFFKTGEINPLLRLQLESEENCWGKYQFYTYQEIGLGSKFTTRQPVILDIDLDYFSCDNSLSSVDKKIEITEKAYLDFRKDKYHPFKIMPVAALSVSKEDDCYYLHYHEWQEVPNLKKVSYKLIDKRIDRFVDFLKQNKIKPRLIDICRSRFSGYTPDEQWEYIEGKLMEGLKQLYSLKVTHIGEFNELDNGTRND